MNVRESKHNQIPETSREPELYFDSLNTILRLDQSNSARASVLHLYNDRHV